MSRPARFWFWTAISAAIFVAGGWRLFKILDLPLYEAILYAIAVAIAIWILGLRIFIGARGPLPRKKLKNPYRATPEEFERLCAAIFEHRGYKVELTSKGADYGVDAIARKRGLTLAIGAKRYAKNRNVGNRWVQQLLGSMQHYGADHAALITTSNFTRQAKEQTVGALIELIDGEQLREIIRKYWL